MTPPAPNVSVVMCVYNAQRFLPDTLRSILGQTLQDFELIVVNDGSTDRSLDILRQFERGDARIRVISRENRGIARSANEGIAVARATYIARHDADDLSHPARLATQAAFLDAHPDVVAVGSQMRITDPYGLPIGLTDFPLDHEGIERELLRGSGWTFPQPAAMFRREAFDRAGGYRERFSNSEDLDLFLRMALVGKLANLPEPLVYWRRHLQSVNHTRAAAQTLLKREIIVEALRARGRAVPEDLDRQLAYTRPLPPWKQLCIWGWKALRAGNARVARWHAWSALRRNPVSPEAWKLAACALRGR
ncbi:MAG: glycosyltransferase [Phycisphaerae bacterium]|nr:glycosyltransferase [Phycisphaerae bacterium]MDW8260902.1 glycosyltransferase [Phycisphaerales bacterium]